VRCPLCVCSHSSPSPTLRHEKPRSSPSYSSSWRARLRGGRRGEEEDEGEGEVISAALLLLLTARMPGAEAGAEAASPRGSRLLLGRTEAEKMDGGDEANSEDGSC